MVKRLDKYYASSEVVTKELLIAAIGPKLGYGQYREVWACKYSNDVVFKVENKFASFQNILEWELWREMQDTEWSGYFAPCVEISGCGAVLTQKRAIPLTSFPDGLTLPNFFQDVKPENFGLIEGRIVCLDYSINWLTRHNFRKITLVPAPGTKPSLMKQES